MNQLAIPWKCFWNISPTSQFFSQWDWIEADHHSLKFEKREKKASSIKFYISNERAATFDPMVNKTRPSGNLNTEIALMFYLLIRAISIELDN